MRKRGNEYDSYVEHPRYGRGPRRTGLNPETQYEPGLPMIKLHWHTPPENRVPDTAIKADVGKQIFTTMPVTHYFDSKRVCRDCGRPFLFFAEEQRYWYEELQFTIECDCVCCVPCRKKEQGIARRRQRYEELCHVEKLSDEERLEMADCCLGLIEASLFSTRQLERVRGLLKKVGEGHAKEREELLARVKTLEAKPG
jgi:hypothetical protein